MEEQEKTGNKIDLSGHWFVWFGVELEAGKLEGSRIITLNGKFDPDDILSILIDKIQETLPKYARDFLDEHDRKVVIRSFNRIDPTLTIGS